MAQPKAKIEVVIEIDRGKPMDRGPRQPAMRPGDRRPRPSVSFDKSPIVQWFRRASAIVRWAILIVVVGLGAAAIVAIVVAALVTVVENSV